MRKNNMEDVHKEGSGIVFTIYAAPTGRSTIPFGTEYIRNQVKTLQINTDIYHASLPDAVRENTQNAYTDGKFPLLVATKGFGMGIDKPDIRYIVHTCYPNSLEAYYQEAGRAGRDRQHAHSVILSKSRDRRCVNDLKNVETYEPPCASSWKCFYTKGLKCDYGMQAFFISSNYPDEGKMRSAIQDCYTQILNGRISENKSIIRFQKNIPDMDPKDYETYMFHLQREKILKDYTVLAYRNSNKQFEVVLADENVSKDAFKTSTERIVKRLQTLKRQKYNMLESIWEYVNNDYKCRRQFLMDYFQDSVNFGPEGCRFCDIEGISEEIAIEATRSTRLESMYDTYYDMLEAESFDYENVKGLLEKSYAENEQESIKIRAMRHLEDYTDNLVALYMRCMVSLRRERSDAYAWNQSLELLKGLIQSEDRMSFPLVLNDLADVDSGLTEDLLFKMEDDLFDGAVAEAVWSSVRDEGLRIITKKKYAVNRLNQISARIERWKTNGHS